MKRILVALVAMLVACGGAVYAQSAAPHGQSHARSMQHGPRQMMAKLNLSDKQKEEATKLRTDLEKSMVGVQSKIKLARIDLRTLVSADSPDRSAIEGKLKEISDLQYQAKKLAADHAFDFYALLTPEQQKTFKGGLMRMLGSGGMMRGRGMRWGGRMMGEGGMMRDGGMMGDDGPARGERRIEIFRNQGPDDDGGSNQ